MALHFDLSAAGDAAPAAYVTNARIQAANGVLQQYAGGERLPLLLFTLPDNSGLQFVTGDPAPGNYYRLQSVRRVTAWWRSGNHTILNCLENIGQAISHGGNPERAFRDGFSVQPVTEQFFADYKRVYADTVRLLTPAARPQDAEQFTQTLFNRLLFIHFISRKGWLTFNGSADYLNALWADYQQQPGRRGNFHADRLSILFHAGMNTPETERPAGVAAIIGQVPFLNGGLFEPNARDQQNIPVPDDAIAEIIGSRGLFNRYNFTVMEATPLDTEVAVDPEMLGKLFEETVNERHSHGAYYTPRPVVAFMCREAIKGYLTADPAADPAAALPPEQIAALVDDGNAAAVTPAQAAALATRLGAVKALDPACGSGAFLLGMLQEIMAVNATLFRAGVTPESLYQQKLDLIRRNLHGVDQDKNAVHIAMLRLWLSLAVEFDGPGPPPPLPNLDLKLLDGDALTAAAPDAAQQDLTDYALAAANLGNLIAAYTDANNAIEKDRLKTEIAAAQNAIRSGGVPAPEGALAWRVDFADVHAAGGFDLVIANPPYVRQEEIAPADYKNRLLQAYPAAAVGRSDLYCYFYARALQLLKTGGLQAFVCSNSWLDVGYGAKLQEYLLDNATIEAIYESAVERQFSTAAINTIISFIRRGPPAAGHETRFIRLLEEFDAAVKPAGQKRIIAKTAAELRAAGTDPEKVKPANKRGQGGSRGYVGDKWGGKYLRAPDIYHHILAKYGDKLVRLGDIATVRRGITSGANAFFYLKPDRVKEFGIEEQFLAPVMTSPTESRSLIVNPATLPKRIFLCHQDKADLKGTGALGYIEWGESQGYHRRPTCSTRPRWYDLGEHIPPPLTMNRIIDERVKAFTMPPGAYASDTLQEIHADPETAAALADSLNDDFAQVQYNIAGRANFGGGALELKIYETEGILVENPNIISGGRRQSHPGGTPVPGGGFEGAGEPPAAAGAVGLGPAVIAFGPLMRLKCPFLIPPAGVHLDKRLYYLYLPETLLPSTALVLNSTVAMLMIQYAGRANMSGIIELATYETSNLLIPNPWEITAPDLEILAAADYGLVARDRRTESGFRLTLTDTRRQIDAPVFAYLGLTPDEQDEIYNATYQAIVNRQIAEANVS